MQFQKNKLIVGLGHYSDVFDQIDTTAIGARNFKIAKQLNRPNLVMICATCRLQSRPDPRGIIDNTGEDYLFSPDEFIVVEN